jgi:hypothetical protein
MPRYLMACVAMLVLFTGAAEAQIRCDRFGCGLWSTKASFSSGSSARQTSLSSGSRATILPHPRGCPRTRYCGCGVSVRIFGKPVRELFLARNWFRFPRARPAPGRVAVRRGHVFVIERVLDSRTVLAYDPNSGGRKTRLHRRSLAGFKVVDPARMSGAEGVCRDQTVRRAAMRGHRRCLFAVP